MDPGDLVNQTESSACCVSSRGWAMPGIVLGNHDLYLLMVAAGYNLPGARGRRPRRVADLSPSSGPWRLELVPGLGSARSAPRRRGGCGAGWPKSRVPAPLAGNRPIAGRTTGWDRLRVIVNAMTRLLRFCRGAWTTCQGRAATQRRRRACCRGSALPTVSQPYPYDRLRHWSALGFYHAAREIAPDRSCCVDPR